MPSMWSAAEASRLRALIESSLRCPKCPATNRPGATYVELSENGTRAYCSVCSASGPTEQFQPKEK
jgi:hypothetical protein